MTDDFPLPPELQRLEQALSARPREQPSDELKQRCLRGIQAELRTQHARSRWTFAVAVAATVLVGLNLSMSASQATDFGFQLGGQQPSLEETAAEVRLLLPEVSPQEAMRHALLLQSGARILPIPDVAGRVTGDKNLNSGELDLLGENHGLCTIMD